FRDPIGPCLTRFRALAVLCRYSTTAGTSKLSANPHRWPTPARQAHVRACLGLPRPASLPPISIERSRRAMSHFVPPYPPRSRKPLGPLEILRMARRNLLAVFDEKSFEYQ